MPRQMLLPNDVVVDIKTTEDGIPLFSVVADVIAMSPYIEPIHSSSILQKAE